MILGCATVHFADKAGNQQEQQACRIATLEPNTDAPDWASASALDLSASDLDRDPAPDRASFVSPPAAATKAKNFAAWNKSLADALFRTATIELLSSPALKLTAKAGESERDFRARVDHTAREQRDADVEELRRKYAPKLATLEERKRRAEQAEGREREQANQAKLSTAISIGAAVLGAFFGRKKFSAGNIGRAGTAARGVGRSVKESGDIARAQETVAAVDAQIQELDQQLNDEIAALTSRAESAAAGIEKLTVRPKKTDITVNLIALAWAPHWQIGETLTPAWE
jgi:hypothetical protein